MNTWPYPMPIAIPSLIMFSLLAAAALGYAVADWRSGYGSLSRGDAALASFFSFFGIGAVPPLLAVAVLLGTGTIAGATLDIIAHLHLAERYPAWFPASALASGLGVGLLCTRLLAATPVPHDPYANQHPGQHHDPLISAREVVPAAPDPAYKNRITF
jgi:hypothetical protein